MIASLRLWLTKTASTTTIAATEDTTEAVTITATGQLADGADSLTLKTFTVTTVYMP